jgi:tetratricopeptide (TPR) repeat protein
MTRAKFIALFFLVFCFGTGFSQNSLIDSLKTRLNEVAGEEKIRTLIGLSYHYLRISTDSSLFYSDWALQYSNETQNERGVARALLMKGSASNYQGNFQIAVKFQRDALEIFEKLNDTVAIGITLNNLGTNYQSLGDYSRAVDQYQKSLMIARNQANSTSIYYALNNLGTIYDEWDKYDLALEYYEEALEIAKDLNDQNYICISLQNIGIIQHKLGNFDEAILSLEESLLLNEQIGTTEGIYNTYINRGEIYQKQNKLELAIADFKKALEVCSKEINQYNISEASLKLGSLYTITGKYGLAETMLNEALNVAKELEDPILLKDIYKALSAFYSKNNDFAKAYAYFVDYTILKDTIYNRESRHEISEMQTLYELDKKEKEIEIQNLKIDQQQSRFYYIISGVLLLIILAILIFNRYKLKQNQVRIELEKKNIEFEQRLLRTQMNPHFIFNSLNSINSFITDNNADSAQTFLSKFARLMRFILENSRKTMVPLEDEVSTLQLNLELEQLRFNHKFDFKIEIDENVDQEFTFIPPMLLQPFVENAILHGVAALNEKGMIHIKMTPVNKLMYCTVEDNGIGRQKAMEIKGNRTRAKHKSLGMQVTRERLDILKEKTGEDIFVRFIDLKDENNKPRGTRVELHIPFEEE